LPMEIRNPSTLGRLTPSRYFFGEFRNFLEGWSDGSEADRCRNQIIQPVRKLSQRSLKPILAVSHRASDFCTLGPGTRGEERVALVQGGDDDRVGSGGSQL